MKKIAYVEMFNNEMKHPWYRVTRELMFSFIKTYLDKNSKILDAGCGTGGTIKYLKKLGYKNIYGIDKSSLAVSFCRKRGLKEIRISRLEKIPFENNYFDAIICLDVLYHKDVQVQNSVKEFKRVLKKGAILYLEEPAYDWLRGTHDYVIETSHRFTLNELKKILETENLKIIKSSHFNIILFPLIVFKRFMDRLLPDRKSGSDVYPLPKIASFFFTLLLNLESKSLNFLCLPFGLSIVLLCKK